MPSALFPAVTVLIYMNYLYVFKYHIICLNTLKVSVINVSVGASCFVQPAVRSEAREREHSVRGRGGVRQADRHVARQQAGGGPQRAVRQVRRGLRGESRGVI